MHNMVELSLIPVEHNEKYSIVICVGLNPGEEEKLFPLNFPKRISSLPPYKTYYILEYVAIFSPRQKF